MKMNINGVEWIKCDRCESWRTNNIICSCFKKKINKDLQKILSSNRKNYNHLILISPHGRQMGMSSLGLSISKFLKKGDSDGNIY